MDKIKYTRHQVSVLEAAFKRKHYANTSDIQKLSQELGVSTKRLRTWFQNRRARDRRRESAEQNCLTKKGNSMGTSLSSAISSSHSGSNSPEPKNSTNALLHYGNILRPPMVSSVQRSQSHDNAASTCGHFQCIAQSYESVPSPCGYIQQSNEHGEYRMSSYGFFQNVPQFYENTTAIYKYSQQSGKSWENISPSCGYQQGAVQFCGDESSPLKYSQGETVQSSLEYPHQYAQHCDNGGYPQRSVQHNGTASNCDYSNQSRVLYYNNESVSWCHQTQNPQVTGETTSTTGPAVSPLATVESISLLPDTAFCKEFFATPTAVVEQHNDLTPFIEENARDPYDAYPEYGEDCDKNEIQRFLSQKPETLIEQLKAVLAPDAFPNGGYKPSGMSFNVYDQKQNEQSFAGSEQSPSNGDRSGGEVCGAATQSSGLEPDRDSLFADAFMGCLDL